MKTKSLILLFLIAVLAAVSNAQDIDPVARAARWKEFNQNKFEQLNYAKVRLTPTRLAKLKTDENADDLALLRGVVFGKRGRIFKERSIQDYLEKQAWYKPSKNYTNSMLTPTRAGQPGPDPHCRGQKPPDDRTRRYARLESEADRRRQPAGLYRC